MAESEHFKEATLYSRILTFLSMLMVAVSIASIATLYIVLGQMLLNFTMSLCLMSLI